MPRISFVEGASGQIGLQRRSILCRGPSARQVDMDASGTINWVELQMALRKFGPGLC
jgi:hypothetical protein